MTSIAQYIYNERKKKKLRKLLDEKKCPELLYFIEDVDSLRKLTNTNMINIRTFEIYRKYITNSSKYQINISSDQYEYINNEIYKDDTPISVFDDVYHSVLSMITDHITDLKPKKNFFSKIKEKIYSQSFNEVYSKKEYRHLETKKSSFF